MREEMWRKRVLRRADFSARITHLTKRKKNKNALNVLFEILDSKELKGSDHNGFIVGTSRAVCFQELPLYALAENVFYEKELFDNSNDSNCAPRYEPFGIRFNKGQCYQNHGARPVIYGSTKELKDSLPPEEYWRIVNLDYTDSRKIIDWTHEREWRVKDNLNFEYSEIEVIVEDPESFRKFIEYYQNKKPNLLREIQGIIVLNSLLT